jgi:hypothetical protein
MSRYFVSFMQDVLGANGRYTEVCRSTFEIDAPSEGEATELAKQKFRKGGAAVQMDAVCGPHLHQHYRLSIPIHIVALA